MYDHFQKTRQLARGEGKIEFSVDIRCIGTSGKTARSARPKVDLLAHRNAWKRGVAPGKNVPQPKRARIPCILLLYVHEKDYWISSYDGCCVRVRALRCWPGCSGLRRTRKDG